MDFGRGSPCTGKEDMRKAHEQKNTFIRKYFGDDFYYSGNSGGTFGNVSYLTVSYGKAGECVQYYPELKEEAQDILWKFCLGMERLTGIPADKSCFYINRQAELLLKCIFSGRNSMNTAVVSVKGCACLIGTLAICIVFAILFLQEREHVYAILEKCRIFGNIIHILREMAVGIKGYLRSPV